MRNKKIILGVFTILIAVILTSCFAKKNDELVEIKSHIAVITKVGESEDENINNKIISILDEDIFDDNIDINILEVVDNNYSVVIKEAINSGSNIVVIIGDEEIKDLKEIAIQNKEVEFIVVSNTDVEIDDKVKNIKKSIFTVEETSFLAGALSALKSETNSIAYISQEKSLDKDNYRLGFIAGAKYINSDISIVVKQLSQDPSISEAFEITQKAIEEDKADIIYYKESDISQGIIDASETVYRIEADSSIDKSKSKNVLMYGIKNLEKFFGNLAIIIANKNNNIDLENLNLKEGYLDFELESKLVSEEIQEKIKEIRKKLLDKSINIPQNDEEI